MAGYCLAITKNAAKDIENLNPLERRRVGKKILWLSMQTDPKAAGAKLSGKAGNYRIRVGSYRIVYDVESRVVQILRVAHRREVYR